MYRYFSHNMITFQIITAIAIILSAYLCNHCDDDAQTVEKIHTRSMFEHRSCPLLDIIETSNTGADNLVYFINMPTPHVQRNNCTACAASPLARARGLVELQNNN